jgi:hypothetical protein
LAKTAVQAAIVSVFTLAPWTVTAYRNSPKVVGPQKGLCMDKLQLTGQNLGRVSKWQCTFHIALKQDYVTGLKIFRFSGIQTLFDKTI